MKDIVDKITSYNLFNYLLPGVLFVVVLDKVTTFSLIQNDLVVGVFVYYFVGLVVSRVGSLVVEPLLREIGFLKFVDYKDFVVAFEEDPKIESLSETNNMYRTFVAMFLLLVVLKIYEIVAMKYVISDAQGLLILVVVLLFMFVFSYRKQTEYVVDRVRSNVKSGRQES